MNTLNTYVCIHVCIHVSISVSVNWRDTKQTFFLTAISLFEPTWNCLCHFFFSGHSKWINTLLECHYESYPSSLYVLFHFSTLSYSHIQRRINGAQRSLFMCEDSPLPILTHALAMPVTVRSSSYSQPLFLSSRTSGWYKFLTLTVWFEMIPSAPL